MVYYFCYTDSKAETEVIQEVKPEYLLLSYSYFKNKPLFKIVERFGYTPKIMLDSGAFTAYTKGKNIALPDYLNYILNNKKYIYYYIALDVINDSYITYQYYLIMKAKGFNPIPVFHYQEDFIYLARYYNNNERYIALGGTVPEKNKEKVKIWIETVTSVYSDLDLHLLGTSSKRFSSNLNIVSCDSSTWVKRAFFGNLKQCPELTKNENKKRIMKLLIKKLSYNT